MKRKPMNQMSQAEISAWLTDTKEKLQRKMRRERDYLDRRAKRGPGRRPMRWKACCPYSGHKERNVNCPTCGAPGRTSTTFPFKDRERRILGYLAEGKTNREIGDLMHIGDHTVAIYINLMLSKVHLRNRTQLAIHALREGWISFPREFVGKPSS